MSKHMAEQARDWLKHEAKLRAGFAPLYEERQLIDMADAIDALLRERESAKARVTDEIVRICLNVQEAKREELIGSEGWKPYFDADLPSMRAALEAVAPMLASAGATYKIADSNGRQWTIVGRAPDGDGFIVADDGELGWVDNAGKGIVHTNKSHYDIELVSTPMLASAQEPIPMVLHCPSCGMQHIDKAETHHLDLALDQAGMDDSYSASWDNPPHRSHLCHGCGTIWRPADVPTKGVAKIKTQGKNDRMLASARVPDELKSAPASPLHPLWGDGYLRGWNACRSAMLAAAPKPETEE